MEILLIRHVESSKNVKARFSTKENREKLTLDGLEFGVTLASCVSTFIKNSHLSVSKVYCANTTRTIETAKLITNKVNLEIRIDTQFNSMQTLALSGMTENEGNKINPLFISQIKMYELGLLNGYDIKAIDKGENLREFEARVWKAFNRILKNKEIEMLKIIILHKSSIQAVLINLLRKYRKYSQRFYGYVQIDIGNICLLRIEKDTLILKAINLHPNILNKKAAINTF